ncbi:MAG: hypothetical protein IJU29_03995 [Oscillospiraceae bacterium]|nr:hypothetical protein [Oscillospiraceae bacterium]
MDELTETLNRVLSDPAELERLTRMASGILGGGAAEGQEQPDGAGGAAPLRAAMAAASGDDGVNRLISALVPYLGQERGKKLRRAARLAKMARMAGFVLGEGERLGDV